MSREVAFRNPGPRHPDSEEAFASMCEAFDQARSVVPKGLHEFRFTVAASGIRMSTAGEDLALLMRHPFRHLVDVSSVDTNDLVVDLWDEEATGIPCPAIARQGWTTRPEGASGAGIAIGTPDDRYVGYQHPGICLWIDRRTGRAVGWFPSSRLSEQERGKPLQFAIHLLQADRGTPVIHAALVAHQGAGALLVGNGGKGKTTAALACVVAGFDFFADDYVAVERLDADRFVGHSLYDSVWLTPHGWELFSGRMPLPGRPACADSEKRLVHLSDVCPSQVRSSVPIHAVVSTDLGDDRCAGHPISKAEALLAVAPSSLLQLPVSGRILFERMTELLSSTPCYRLDVGRDPTGVATLVAALLKKEDSLR